MVSLARICRICSDRRMGTESGVPDRNMMTENDRTIHE